MKTSQTQENSWQLINKIHRENLTHKWRGKNLITKRYISELKNEAL